MLDGGKIEKAFDPSIRMFHKMETILNVFFKQTINLKCPSNSAHVWAGSSAWLERSTDMISQKSKGREFETRPICF